MQSMLSVAKKHKKLLGGMVTIIILAPVLAIVGCYFRIEPYKKFVVSPEDAQHSNVGIVLGAGINSEGKPYKELEARLDSAASALDAGLVDKLILSGDNRFEDYDEPGAMKEYLVETKKVPPQKLVLDYAGRSTYESCERAAKIFGLKKATIFSVRSHLPRAIYLCREFGIEAYGIPNGVEANNSTRRELLARVKAVYNTELVGEPTVLGDPISLN